MQRALKSGFVLAGVTAGRAALRAAASMTPGLRTASDRAIRWHVVTVNRAAFDVAPDGVLPAPLADLGDAIEVQIRPAPGDRGTELAARWRNGEPSGLAGSAARLSGDDPRQRIRSALRQSKQLLETGEILRAHSPPTTRRTPGGRVMEFVTTRAGGEGRL
jgi:hypothetical protein